MDNTNNEYPRVLSATTLIGDKVVNTAGEQLGSITELMIDLDDGLIAYAVLSFGGILGMGNKLFAIPWEAITIDTENHNVILDVDKEVLENAPGFDKDNWPDNAKYEAGWLLGVYEYYGYSPYWMPDEEDEIQDQRENLS
ncbi:MAG TPA: PRC-barrel domain-containing protein [Anaerolineales bacterium]|jgi:sporulation protein YlmC with PRC-barrel domain|nr:PRC-barrel domain-containing protein [Anaerolineales bacterium]